ncbi:hypothetical protein [Streptomyces sp. CB03911]|uniref:hypothetical protein n=1 Tax=Streptomyces sp. CB03911 TaxID=1804758 RepID=UPI00093F3555|nr:hypothetical protein [Streptomyces sp. CB03911]OKI25058.1 hypothetical protein A6A07_31145 [Streptomyces sp. CB03911]
MPLPRGLRRRCERVLAGLDLPEPFTVEAFRAALAEQRGRPIVLEPLPDLGPDAPCGLWISLPSVDVVLYRQSTSPAHQDLIKLHELGHLLRGHRQDLALDSLAGSFTALTPELVTGRLAAARSHYDNEQEQEAEMIAVLLADLAGAEQFGSSSSRRLAGSLAHPVRGPRRWRGD